MKCYCYFIILFLSFSGLAFEELVTQELYRIVNSKNLQSQNITASFDWIPLGHDEFFGNTATFKIWLHNEKDVKIGHIYVKVNDYFDQADDSFFSEATEYNRNDFRAGRLSQMELKRRITSLRNFTNHNFALIDLIEITDSYKRKGLSYPLICAAARVLKLAFKKEFIVLNDAAEIDSYYEKIGFKRLVSPEMLSERDFKSALIYDIINSSRCKNL